MELGPSLVKLSSHLTRPLVVFDLETTTNDIKVAETIQFAGIRVDQMGLSTTLQFMCKPDGKIEPGATEVHGVSDDMVKDQPPFSQFASEVAKFFAGADVGGYNIARFDLPILDRELRQAGFLGVLDQANIVDSFLLFTDHFPRNLTQAVNYYTGQTLENAHDALEDVRATVAVMSAQLEQEETTSQEIADRYHLTPERRIGFSGLLLIDDQGQTVINFGKNKGKRLDEVEHGFLEWVLSKDFPEEVKDAIYDFLR